MCMYVHMHVSLLSENYGILVFALLCNRAIHVQFFLLSFVSSFFISLIRGEPMPLIHSTLEKIQFLSFSFVLVLVFIIVYQVFLVGFFSFMCIHEY